MKLPIKITQREVFIIKELIEKEIDWIATTVPDKEDNWDKEERDELRENWKELSKLLKKFEEIDADWNEIKLGVFETTIKEQQRVRIKHDG